MKSLAVVGSWVAIDLVVAGLQRLTFGGALAGVVIFFVLLFALSYVWVLKVRAASARQLVIASVLALLVWWAFFAATLAPALGRFTGSPEATTGPTPSALPLILVLLGSTFGAAFGEIARLYRAIR